MAWLANWQTSMFLDVSLRLLLPLERYSPVNVDSSDSEDDLSESTPFAKHSRVHLYQQPEEDDELCKLE